MAPTLKHARGDAPARSPVTPIDGSLTACFPPQQGVRNKGRNERPTRGAAVAGDQLLVGEKFHGVTTSATADGLA